MNTTDIRSKDCTPAYDEIQVLLRRAHEERSKYLASELQLAATAFSRWGARRVFAAYTAVIGGLDPRVKHQPPEDRRRAQIADRQDFCSMSIQGISDSEKRVVLNP